MLVWWARMRENHKLSGLFFRRNSISADFFLSQCASIRFMLFLSIFKTFCSKKTLKKSALKKLEDFPVAFLALFQFSTSLEKIQKNCSKIVHTAFSMFKMLYTFVHLFMLTLSYIEFRKISKGELEKSRVFFSVGPV